MAYHFNDNVYTRSFTPREPQVELLDAACERNIIVCLCNASGKTFIASKIINHVANRANSKAGKVTLYVADSSGVVCKHASCLRRLTDFDVGQYENINMFTKETEWKESIGSHQVLVTTTQVALMFFKQKILKMSQINLIILHGCHCVVKKPPVLMREVNNVLVYSINQIKEQFNIFHLLFQLMKFYDDSHEKPHVLGLANSLFSSGLDPSQLEAEINKMEKILSCRAETASNVVSVLRYGNQPHEVVLECAPCKPTPIDLLVEKEIQYAISFLQDHRYDPNEIYEGFSEELQDIPDPRTEPVEIFLELLDTLHTLGEAKLFVCLTSILNQSLGITCYYCFQGPGVLIRLHLSCCCIWKNSK